MKVPVFLLSCYVHDVTKQVDELLNEVKPSRKKTVAVTHFVEKLRSLLLGMKNGKREHQVSS